MFYAVSNHFPSLQTSLQELGHCLSCLSSRSCAPLDISERGYRSKARSIEILSDPRDEDQHHLFVVLFPLPSFSFGTLFTVVFLPLAIYKAGCFSPGKPPQASNSPPLSFSSPSILRTPNRTGLAFALFFFPPYSSLPHHRSFLLFGRRSSRDPVSQKRPFPPYDRGFSFCH